MQGLLFDLRYILRPPWDTRVSPPELLDYLSTHPAGAALDMGCGTGTNVIALARAGWRATGVDFSRLAIRRARRRVLHAGLSAQLLVADVARPLLLQQRYDLVLDIGCFHMLGDRTGYLRNLGTLLRDGGHWLVYGFLSRSASSREWGFTSDVLDSVSSTGLKLLQRQDGMYSGRASAWFLFARRSTGTPDRDLTGRRD
ncbi:MAG TPA: class I SAM-dependent methyltransferase [Anaerolineales bacterium]|nr:class I SAM-dependent methyltransferase [Anaerolineales bacterium]